MSTPTIIISHETACWRLLLEEYAPKIIYIKWIHNTVADAISRLDYDPKLNSTNEYNHATHVMSVNTETNQKWLMCSKFWSCYNKMKLGDTNESKKIQLNQCFANRNEEDEM
jgi:hypothetical protein